jgi:hypothetical protein
LKYLTKMSTILLRNILVKKAVSWKWWRFKTRSQQAESIVYTEGWHPARAPLAEDAGKPGIDCIAFASSQKMLAGHVIQRRLLGEPCAVYTEAGGQLPGEAGIKQLIAFSKLLPPQRG